MPASVDSNLLSRAFDWIRARASRDNELAAMSRMDLRYLANDLGVTEADLREIAPKVTDNSVLMDKMMRARGLDPDAVRTLFGALVRDMEVTCARCRDAGVCRRELAAGTAAVYCHDFCANAETMDELRQARH
jgi:hypothetical protein